MLVLDHIVVAGLTRQVATDFVQESLGVAPLAEGGHPYFGTHNHLWGMGTECYLESIAIDPHASTPSHARWFGLDDFSGPPRIVSWVLSTADINVTLEHLGSDFGVPVRLERSKYHWDISVSDSGALPFGGFGPALIQWQPPEHPCRDLSDSGCRLLKLQVQHPQASSMQNMFGHLLKDARVSFSDGPGHIFAEIQTDHGVVTLE
tara:strand:+ start:258 stop:872 length:615 start_codon:yes stop_codon:yes gene_type:complete